MKLWRLSSRLYAEATDGGYGLFFDGRWNTAGRLVTYAATAPSLCVLEKLVHVEDPALLPELAMVRYDVPDAVSRRAHDLAELPQDWRSREGLTQTYGDVWLRGRVSALLFVPSAIVAVPDAPDRNVLINPLHADATRITIDRVERFQIDIRLFVS